MLVPSAGNSIPRSLAQRVILHILVNKSIYDFSGANGCLRKKSLPYAFFVPCSYKAGLNAIEYA